MAYAGQPAAAPQSKALEKAEKKEAKDGDKKIDLSKLPPAARHGVRIAGKKLRYMTEFLQPLAKSKEQRREHRRFVKRVPRTVQ